MQHKRLTMPLAGALLALAITGGAHAQYTGPSDSAAGRVSAILENPVDDQMVRIEGTLVRKTGHEMYIFSDGTGEIAVEIDDKRFHGQPVDENTRVEIYGEVDTGRNRPPEIEVKSLRIVR